MNNTTLVRFISMSFCFKNTIFLFVFLFVLDNAFSQSNDCATATPLVVNGVCLTSTTDNITDTTQNLPNIGTCPGTFAREGWYTFTVAGGPLNIIISAEANNSNLFLQLISSSSSCTGLAQIDCANNTNSNGAQTETISRSLANGIYYVKVVNVSGNNNMRLNSICVTSVSALNVPSTGNNNVTCGTNTMLYDNGGVAGNYINSSNGYTVLDAGFSSTITISGNYTTESSFDFIRIYSGVGTGGTLLNSYSGTGSINYTGTVGQSITVQFTSDGSGQYSGFAFSVTYSGTCYPACSGTPTGGSATTSPNTTWPGNPYTVSASGYTQALNMTYQWQYSTNSGVTWLNAGTATSTYSNYNAIAPASGNVNWQLITTCTNSTISTASSTGIFVTLAVSDVATGCPNVVSGGLGLNGADPAPITCLSPSGCVDLEATYLNLGNTTSYIVEPITYNPPWAFTGLSNPISVNTDDVWSSVINLPFNFCFYGNTYTNCLVGSNGVITFDTTNNTSGSTCEWNIYGSDGANLPVSGHAALVENSIFGGFQDLDPTNAGIIGSQLVTLPTGCKALVVAWSQVPLYSNDNVNKFTGMTVLYENSNIIEVYIQKKTVTTYPGSGSEGMWNDGNAVIGIQNANGTLASVPPGRNVLDPNWTATNEAWRFVPNGTSIASIKWHEGSGVSGTVVGTTDIINVCPANTTVYTAEITYTLCDGRTITEIDETTVTVNKDKVWDGSSNTDWNTAANWTPSGVPTFTESVTIPNVANDPIINAGADAVACSLNVESGAVLTLSAGKNLTVTNTITVAATGTFNVKNAANLVQINNAAVNTGIINMERVAAVRLQDYSYWSSPVGNLGAGTFPVQSVSPATPAGYIFKWGTTTPNANGGQGTWVSTSENMIPAKGYILRAPNGFTNTTTSPLTANFIGIPNNGVFSPNIYRGTDFTGAGTQGMLRTISDDNWNLVGNPYPSSIGVNEFLTLPANNTIVGGVRIWTHGQLPTNSVDPFYQNYVFNYYPNDYITINLTGATSGPLDYKIGAGQGFMVLMNDGAAGSATVTFNNAMRSASFANNSFYKSSSESNATETIEQNRIWLDLVAPTGSVNRLLVGYVSNATQAEDRLYDSFTDYKPSQNFYSLIGNNPMAIQGRTLPFDVNDTVNLGVTIPQNGTYSIAISALDGLFETTNQTIYIEDTQTNIIHNLRQNPYSFSAISGNDPNRFVLRYTNGTLANEDFINDASSVWVSSTNELTVKSSKTEIQSVRVFDILGRELANFPNVNGYEIPLTKIQKNNSGLIIQVTLKNGIVINKKTIY